MIFDSVNHAPDYRGMSPAMDTALMLMQTVDFFCAPLGRQEADNGVFYTVMECDLVDQQKAVWEHHNRYIDIQWVLSGREKIDVLPVSQVKDWDPFNTERDATFSSDPVKGTTLELYQDMFALFFPWDAHRCLMEAGEGKTVRKVVIKIPV